MPGSARAPDLMVIEPRGRYARRAPVVVDASVIAAALFDEPTRVEASEALEGTEAHAPDLLDHELVNVALKKQSAGLGTAARESLEMLLTLEITRHRVDPLVQWELASQHTLSAYDAAYLALAVELGCPLITFDQKLAAAARRLLQDD
jgi:predicted nucleic acid-binding protein